MTTQRIPYEEIVAWFAASDICWITPRGWLNLVAKVVAARKGEAAACSRNSPVWWLLMARSLLTYSHRRMDEAIDAALMMPVEEQRARMERMESAVDTLSVANWASEQLNALEH